jgi:hypothetical protein
MGTRYKQAARTPEKFFLNTTNPIVFLVKMGSCPCPPPIALQDDSTSKICPSSPSLTRPSKEGLFFYTNIHLIKQIFLKKQLSCDRQTQQSIAPT